MHQNEFPLGLRPRPRWGSLQRPQTPYLDLRGPTSKAGEGGLEKEGQETGKEGKGGKEGGREGRGAPPLYDEVYADC